MEDPGWAWPYWKFGLSKDDLSSTLHDRYNTFPSSIQDPEAFHHDVYEISHDASTADEFHRLLADRKQRRLRELNDSLESASLEIIANPSLIGTDQWQHALQLFRTKSLDSLVRYFASYLPDNHPWHKPTIDDISSGSSASSISDTISSSVGTLDSLPESQPYFFDDEYDDEHLIMTHEPLPISKAAIPTQLPPSPRSMTMCSDKSLPTNDAAYLLGNMTPARTLSFSESESERSAFSHLEYCAPLDDDLSQPYYSIDTLATLVFRQDMPGTSADAAFQIQVEETNLVTTDDFETRTPKSGQTTAAPFFDVKPSLPRRRHRSSSPSRPHPLCQVHTHVISHQPRSTCLMRRGRDRSPALLLLSRSRYTPGATTARIQKSSIDSNRARPRGRRLADC